MKKLCICFFVILFCSCGYKPMSYFANKALGHSIFVKLGVNLENPEESVSIKDLMNEAIMSRFHSLVTNEERAETVLELNVLSVRDTIIATNSQGFATFYRVFLTISFKFERDGKTFSFANPSYYDYTVSLNNPIVTYNNRSAAILEAAKQSIDRFISQVGYSSVL